MDNLGSEVGQKMRSAVKAKLLELGTGGSAGYIDDELPDYVMIMVANKRSKTQMISDLNLFLGTQTDLFVTWLHEVLQKLQEVTLPAVALQKKRKTSQKDEAILNKKDKKDKKKDKKMVKKSSEQEFNEITSITDVFAGEFLEKAKKTFEIDADAVQKGKKQEQDSPSQKDETDNFNIPTISEMSSTQRVITSETREKDLAELADIQKKIYAAKKQLKILDDVDESEDEDFLNIKEDGEEFEENNEMAREKKKQAKAKSPIVFDKNQEEPVVAPVLPKEPKVVASSVDSNQPDKPPSSSNSASSRMPVEFGHHRREVDRCEEPAPKEGQLRKKSIHERLGNVTRVADFKSDHSHQLHRRAEIELYIPAFRRREMEKEKRSNGELDNRSKRKRSISRDRNKKDSSPERPSQQRIGSRVVVAPPKPDSIDEDVDNQRPDRPVNSVIKIKPRPSISPSKQACKNLLLRAVAEAQRSTILIKPKKDIPIHKSSSSGVGKTTKRNTKFFTKSFRDRISRDALIRRTAKSLVIEVQANTDIHHEDVDDDEQMDQNEEEEYVPENLSDKGESDMEHVYIPQTINFEANEDEEIKHETIDILSKTQFVVTMNEKNSKNFKTKSKNSRLNGGEHSSRSDRSDRSGVHKSSREKVDIRSRLTLKKEKEVHIDRESNSSPSYSTPPRPSSAMSSSKKSELIKIYKRPKEVKKIVIKNDSEDEEMHSPKKESPSKAITPHVIIKDENIFPTDEKPNIPSEIEEDGSMTPPLPIHKHETNTPPEKITPSKRKRQLIKFDLVNKQQKTEDPVPAKRRSKSGERENEQSVADTNADEGHKISTRNVESKKYDNLPSSLNSVPIDSSLVIKSKPKERCKFFPSCTKDNCEFYHPATPCKSFPNCKFADKCLYVHPKCKFDLTCTKIGCNFQHTTPMLGQLSAPPLSSHVVPVQNYKSISSSAATPSMCKFYPNCSKPSCPFFHPKMCRFGRNCINKMECNFYHHDAASSKFKWVASVV